MGWAAPAWLVQEILALATGFPEEVVVVMPTAAIVVTGRALPPMI